MHMMFSEHPKSLKYLRKFLDFRYLIWYKIIVYNNIGCDKRRMVIGEFLGLYFKLSHPIVEGKGESFLRKVSPESHFARPCSSK
jgi:hypothetical protein